MNSTETILAQLFAAVKIVTSRTMRVNLDCINNSPWQYAIEDYEPTNNRLADPELMDNIDDYNLVTAMLLLSDVDNPRHNEWRGTARLILDAHRNG